MNRFNPVHIDRMIVLITLLVFAGAGMAHAAKVALVWDKPDGDVAGYRIYYGLDGPPEAAAGPGRTVEPDQTRCEISGLVQGQRYWFRMTCFNRNGVESALSEKLFHEVPILEANNDGIGDAAIAIGATDGTPPGDDAPVPDDPAEEPGGDAGDPDTVPETPDPPADRAPAANPGGNDGGEETNEESGGGGGGGGGGTCFIGSLAQ